MKTLFYGMPLAVLMLVKFDTQDNLYFKNYDIGWRGQTEQSYNVKRESYKGKDILRIKLEEPAKRIVFNDFPYSYKVKKINNKEFIVTSKYWQKYWDSTDTIETLIIK